MKHETRSASRRLDAASRRSAVRLCAGGLIAILAARAHGGGGSSSTCQTVCDTLTSTQCTISTTKAVLGGSAIDCGNTVDVFVSGGHLQVHGAQFYFKAKSFTVNQSGSIDADCPDGTGNPGFSLIAAAAISLPVNSGGKLTARCGTQGGLVRLEAGGNVDINALGIDASGTAQDAAGGTINIVAQGTVTTTAQLVAGTTGGLAAGGTIEIRGSAITIGEALTATGSGTTSGQPGGSIVLDSDGNITANTGLFSIDASTSQGDGGSITLRSGAAISVSRPLKVRGIGPGTTGGSVDIDGESIDLDNDVTATGGQYGGNVHIESRSGKVRFGANSSSVFTVDASGNNSSGGGGTVTVLSAGNDVNLLGSSRLYATDGGAGAPGGSIQISGVTVSSIVGTQMIADGGVGKGGTIGIQARENLTLAGTVRAVDGLKVLTYRQGTPDTSGVVAPFTLLQNSSLPAPCGDGVRRATLEACDGTDLNGQTCVTLGHAGGGTLACTASCSFDETGCVN